MNTKAIPSFEADDDLEKAQVAGGVNSQRVEFRNLIARTITAFALVGITALILPFTGHFSYFLTCSMLLIIGVLIRSLQILSPGRFTFIGLRERALSWYESLERHQQLYFNVFLFLPFLGYVYMLDAQSLYPSMVQVFVLYCLGVAAFDVIRIYSALSTTLYGKGLIAVGFAVGSNLAFSLAGWFIGELTNVAPSTFPHTLSFLAIGAIPILFFILGALYIPIAILVTPFILLTSMLEEQFPRLMKWFFARKFEKPLRRYVFSTLLFQILFYLFLLLTLTPTFFSSIFDRYGKQIEAIVADSIYMFDMYPGAECEVGAEHRVASLGNENYIIASKTDLGVRFEKPRKCTLSGL